MFVCRLVEMDSEVNGNDLEIKQTPTDETLGLVILFYTINRFFYIIKMVVYSYSMRNSAVSFHLGGESLISE